MKQNAERDTEKRNRSKNGLEILRFLVTGGICFAVELLTLMLLRNGLKLDTLVATPVAFLLSVVLNYLLCVTWVFSGARGAGGRARVAFLVTSVIGLVLNELLMLAFRAVFGEEAVLFTLLGKSFTMVMANKSMATLLVTIFNYFAKKRILNPPAAGRG